MRGKLYGVGVGPGESSLMTLKAVRTIKACDIIALPVSDPGLEMPVYEEAGEKTYAGYKQECVAYQTALQEVQEMQERGVLYLPMPMSKEKEKLKAIHNADADWIRKALDKGQSIAFLTLGDPSIYSTYLYLHKRICKEGYEAEIIPGIPSFCAAAARLSIGLAENKEQIHILPSSYGVEEGIKLPGTKILMKAGKKMPAVKEALKDGHHSFWMVENCGMSEENIYERPEDVPDDPGYFSLIIVKKREG